MSYTTGIPNPPVPVLGLLGTGPHNRRWAAGERASLHLYLQRLPHCRLSSASCQHYSELYNYFIIYYNVIIIEIKGTINVMRLNHPKPSPTPPTHPPIASVEKLSSMKPVPGAKKVGDRCYTRSLSQTKNMYWGTSMFRGISRHWVPIFINHTPKNCQLLSGWKYILYLTSPSSLPPNCTELFYS